MVNKKKVSTDTFHGQKRKNELPNIYLIMLDKSRYYVFNANCNLHFNYQELFLLCGILRDVLLMIEFIHKSVIAPCATCFNLLIF